MIERRVPPKSPGCWIISRRRPGRAEAGRQDHACPHDRRGAAIGLSGPGVRGGPGSPGRAGAVLRRPRRRARDPRRDPPRAGPVRSVAGRDRRRQAHGRGIGRFLLLGSAAIDLLAQSGETLAGRIAFVELAPFDVTEVGAQRLDRLWVRGGFPDSFLAAEEKISLRWREDFIRTYLERDVPQLGPRIPAETLRRLWTMFAHNQGGLFNAAQLARGLGVSAKTIAHYLDLMVDLLLVRRLPPICQMPASDWCAHRRCTYATAASCTPCSGSTDKEAVLGHPTAGASWEGMAIENLLTAAGEGGHQVQGSFYRTSHGAEVDLVLTGPRRGVGRGDQAQPVADPGAGLSLRTRRPGTTTRAHRLPRNRQLPPSTINRSDQPRRAVQASAGAQYGLRPRPLSRDLDSRLRLTNWCLIRFCPGTFSLWLRRLCIHVLFRLLRCA